MSDYKPGTVAKATVRGVEDVLVFRMEGFGDYWATAERIDARLAHYGTDVTDVRPLVVLDFGIPGAGPHLAHNLVEDIRAACQPGSPGAKIADQIEAQTKPPKPAEPTELGTVVTDVDGKRWVKADELDGGINWYSPDCNVDMIGWRRWHQIEVAERTEG